MNGLSKQRMGDDEKDYLWKHFAFNAEQRLKAFNFYVLFTIFTYGGFFAAIEKSFHPASFVLLGFFVCLLSFIFWMIDERSRGLLDRTKAGLQKWEASLENTKVQLFTLDERRPHKWISYKNAFRGLFGFQLLFGAFVIAYGLCKWHHYHGLLAAVSVLLHLGEPVGVAHSRWQILEFIERADGNFPQRLPHGIGIQPDQLVGVG